ncbi:MAG: hypothetical protein WCJ02_09115 [bacterium]
MSSATCAASFRTRSRWFSWSIAARSSLSVVVILRRICVSNSVTIADSRLNSGSFSPPAVLNGPLRNALNACETALRAGFRCALSSFIRASAASVCASNSATSAGEVGNRVGDVCGGSAAFTVASGIHKAIMPVRRMNCFFMVLIDNFLSATCSSL